MKITVEDIVQKEFSTAESGYNIDEVNLFLNQICDAIEESEMQANQAYNQFMPDNSAELEKKDEEINRLQALVKQAQHEAAEAKAKLELAPKSQAAVQADQATALLINAQRVYDDTVASANKKALEIQAKAQEEADKKIAGLAREKSDLESELAELKKSFSAYISKVESILLDQQTQIKASKEKFNK